MPNTFASWSACSLATSLLLIVSCRENNSPPQSDKSSKRAVVRRMTPTQHQQQAQDDEVEREVRFDIEEISPPRKYDIIRLKMPRNHGGLKALAWSVDSKWLVGGTGTISMTFQNVTRSKGGDVLIWNMQDQQLRNLGSHGATVDDLLTTPNGKLLISVSRKNRIIKIWQMPTGELVDSLTFPGSYWPRSTWPIVQLSLDGSLLAVVTHDRVQEGGETHSEAGDLLIWETATRKQVLHWRKPRISSLAMTAKPFRIVAVVKEKEPTDPSRATRYLTVWNSLEQESFRRKKLKFDSEILALQPTERVAVRIEAPQLHEVLARYDLEGLQRLESKKIAKSDEIFPGGDFYTTSIRPDRAEYVSWKTAGVIDLRNGRHEPRLKLASPVLGVYTNRFSPDLRYFVLGAKAKTTTTLLQLPSLAQLQQVLRDKLWNDLIDSFETSSQCRVAARKLKKRIQR